jgi:hypothetical protein
MCMLVLVLELGQLLLGLVSCAVLLLLWLVVGVPVAMGVVMMMMVDGQGITGSLPPL